MAPTSPTAPMSARGVVALVLSLLGGMAVLASLHAAFVIPTILSQARAMMDIQIDRHAARVHTASITKDDLAVALSGIHARLDSIERRLDGK